MVNLAQMPFKESLIQGDSVKEGQHHLDPMVFCRQCNASVWIEEWSCESTTAAPKFMICCSQGKVALPPLGIQPQVMELLWGISAPYKIFHQSTQKFNSSLSFTSMGVSLDHELANAAWGSYTFQIQGQVVHRIGSLLPGASLQGATYNQIYIRDLHEQAARHHEIYGGGISKDLLLELQVILEEVNPLCQIYKSIWEHEYGQDIQNLRILLKSGHVAEGGHRGQYNLPTAPEIAVLLPNIETADQKRDIIIECREGGLKRIDKTHVKCNALQYVLLHPRGENGWMYNHYLLQCGSGDAPLALEGKQPVREPAEQSAEHPAEPQFDDPEDHEDLAEDELDVQENSEEGVPAFRCSPYVTARQFYAYRLQI